jgi:acetyl-CoA carboxylase biotin carboxylase subunit
MGEDRSYYFLEMNTRIQVEHPITEEITGIDLLTSMIQIALGENYGISSQAEITKKGHSIECRICSEDPITMLPAPGTVTGFEFTFPQGVRFDHCIYNGYTVTPDFDPMVGKLIVKGLNREFAMRKMRSALDGLIIEGLKNNIPLHKKIFENSKFIEGHYSTNFLSEERPQDKIKTDVDHYFLSQKLISIETNHLTNNF